MVFSIGMLEGGAGGETTRLSYSCDALTLDLVSIFMGMDRLGVHLDAGGPLDGRDMLCVSTFSPSGVLVARR